MYLFLLYLFTFNVVISHEIITFKDICMDKLLKDFTSTKDTYYAALKSWNLSLSVFIWRNESIFSNLHIRHIGISTVRLVYI